MSERTWKPGPHPDWFVTGTPTVGASVHWDVARFRWVAEAWTRDGREMRERGLVTHPAAMVVAERWLDEREAEAQQRAPAALEGTPASSGEPAAKREPAAVRPGLWKCRHCGEERVPARDSDPTWRWSDYNGSRYMHRCMPGAPPGEFAYCDRIGDAPPEP